MQIDYKMSEQEYLEFNLYINNKLLSFKAKMMMVFLPLFCVYIYGLFRLYRQDLFLSEYILNFSKHFFLYTAPIMIAFYAIVKIVFYFYLKQRVKKLYKELEDTLEGTLSLEDTMLVEYAKNATIKTPYKKIQIHKDKKNFYIMISSLQGYILPENKRSREFVEKLSEKMKENLLK